MHYIGMNKKPSSCRGFGLNAVFYWLCFWLTKKVVAALGGVIDFKSMNLLRFIRINFSEALHRLGAFWHSIKFTVCSKGAACEHSK